MSLLTRIRGTADESKTRSRLTLKVPDGARILIVSDADSDTERLKTALREAGFILECANLKALPRVVRLRNPVGSR